MNRSQRYYQKNKTNILEKHQEYLKKTKVNPQFWENFIIPLVRKIKGNKCEVCKSSRNLDVHHTSYEEININTLQLLCRKCHKEAHRRNKYENHKRNI